MLLHRLLGRTLGLVFTVVAASGQIGDRLDRPGVVQKSLVPEAQIPPAPALTPEAALKTFTVAPGFRLELAAAEPQVQEPVAVAFGPDGRMWVVEMRGYMPDLDGNGEDAPVGRIVVLRDADGDGRFEESTVFVDRLVLPRAIAVLADGLLVGAPPMLTFYRDGDGDGKVDRQEVVATDYGVRVDPARPHLANPERAPNSLLWAYDNWIYSAAYTKKFRRVNGQWETGSTSFRGQWGLGQDAFGRLWHGSNSDHLRVDVIHSDYLARNRNQLRLAGTNVNAAADQLVWPVRVTPGINRGYRPEMLRDGRLKEFTAACGWHVYHGDLLPELQGNVFVAEPAAHFVRRAVITPADGTVKGRNAYPEKEFIASTDERFRPVNFATGPDGALYVVDLYRGVLQHRISLTSYLRKQSEDRKLAQPQHLGRIYRVVPDKAAAAKRGSEPVPRTSDDWVARLSHPNGWWRETAQRVLVERRDAAAVPAIRRIAESDGLADGRVRALWTLDGVGALSGDTVRKALAAGDPVVRAHAVRLSERFLGGGGEESESFRKAVLALAQDGATPAVQLQAVLSLGGSKEAALEAELADIVRRHSRSAFLRDALFSGLADRELTLLVRLAGEAAWSADDAEANRMFTGLARGILGARELAGVERVIALAAEALAAGGGKRAVALLDGLVPGAGASRRPLQLAAEPKGWAALEKHATTKARLERLKDVVVWPGKPGAAAIAEAKPLTAAQQARFEAGKVMFTAACATCHQTTGRGLDGLAPPLLDSEWVLGTHERLVRIVLHGVRGPITVLGRVHTGDMPAFGALSDEQISSVLTYVRREWGHTAAPVEPEQVKAIRTATAGHNDAWSPEELMLIK